MNDVTRERRLKEMNSGRMISAAWGQIEPAFTAHKLTSLARMLADFRAGKNAQDLYHHIATLAAIDDLEAQISMQVKRGESAAKELVNGKETEEPGKYN